MSVLRLDRSRRHRGAVTGSQVIETIRKLLDAIWKELDLVTSTILFELVDVM